MNIKPDIIARVKFYSTEEGGRRGPTPPEQFGCMFEFDRSLFDCRLLLADFGSVYPGQEVVLPIKFLSPDLLKGRVKRGDTFFLRELKRIAEGIIEEIT